MLEMTNLIIGCYDSWNSLLKHSIDHANNFEKFDAWLKSE